MHAKIIMIYGSGERVYVDGVKPGRIQFIGDTKFGPGDWAGVFLDEPIGNQIER